jgi:hyperosmotically inducible protein
MKMTGLLMAVSIAATIGFVSCAPKDADIKTDIETKLKAAPDMSGVTVDVKGGIATIEGECKDDVCRANCEKIAQEVKGVKTVINNLTVTQPTAAPVTATVVVTADDPLTKSVVEATKGFPGVKAEVKDSIVTLTGEIKKNDLPGLTKALTSLKPKKIENKLTIIKNLKKKYREPKRRSARKKY